MLTASLEINLPIGLPTVPLVSDLVFSAPPNEGAVNGECGLDGCKLKADTDSKNKASYAEITGKS